MSRRLTAPPRHRARPTPLALAISALLCPPLAVAAPSGGIVTSGTATISQAGTTTTIAQGSQKAAINWQGFSIGAGETVNFQQPGAGAITLNRVVGNEQSVIAGALNANGKVFLINSAGVLFGKGSQVNVGGLVASTLDIRDEDFEAGNYVFRGAGSASVINRGTITAADGGYVALLGRQAINEGVVVATRGTAALAAGSKVTLDFAGDALLGVTLDQGALDALVDNRQAIYADGGRVFLTAKAADDLLGSQVNNSGIVQARTLGELKGEIVAYAYGGTAHIDGTLDASAPTGGDGGFVETSGDHVKIADSAQITTRASAGRHGTWLIDPVDFTIAASGGDMTGALLSSLLGGGNITIASAAGSSGSSGDINVNDAVTWSSDSVLTLSAAHDININNAITASGADAGLALNYGGDYNIRTRASYSGTVLNADGIPVARQDTSGGIYGSVTFSNAANTDGLTINGQTYTLIHSMAQLDAIDGYNAVTNTGTAVINSGRYALATDLDAAGTTYLNSLVGLAVGSSFRGVFTGLGHVIDNLKIATNGPANTALFGYTGNTNVPVTLRDIGLTRVDISAASGTAAALVSSGIYTSLHNAYSTGSVSSASSAGGLAGTVTYGTQSKLFSTATVSGISAGGLIKTSNDNTVQYTHASGEVIARGGGTGGLIGQATASDVLDSYATGNVTTTSSTDYGGTGGLIGQFNGGRGSTQYLVNAFATGDVVGSINVGGLVGRAAGNLVPTLYFTNTYATGDVTATWQGDAGQYAGVGGLIGSVGAANSNVNAYITKSFATGDVRVLSTSSPAINAIGGLVGVMRIDSQGAITDSYATGNIYAPHSHSVGGLLGGAQISLGGEQNLVISGSYATGNVQGFGDVGGLVGSGTGTIIDSYATGTASGSAGEWVGGLVGGGMRNIINSYYNAETNSSHYGGPARGGDDVQGLTGEQFKDIRYYLDGTIDQVLAARAAEAAAQAAAEAAAQVAAQAAAEAAARAAAEAAAQAAAQALLQTRADAGTRSASTTVADMQRTAPPQPGTTAPRTGGPGTVLDDHIVFTDARQFSADIQSIEVGGVIYRLDGGDDDRGATPDASQAPR